MARALSLLLLSAADAGQTSVAIDGEQWRVNGQLTFPGSRAEGTLTNSRMINGIFDDANSETRSKWAYPDTKEWDPERNTAEFVGNMSSWKEAGLLSFTVGLQGGSPLCYGNNGWRVSAFDSEGSLDKAWLARLSKILAEADRLGMVSIVQYFYYEQYPIVGDAARDAAVTRATEWLAQTGYKNIVVDLFNEKCESEWASSVHRVKEVSQQNGNRILVGTSCLGGHLPASEVVDASDFILLHGNGQSTDGLRKLVSSVRDMESFKQSPKPVVFNEDDHGGFHEGDDSNFQAALDGQASWGFLCCCSDAVQGDYSTGFQCPPVDWRMSGSGQCLSGAQGDAMLHGSKAEFADMLRRVTKPQQLSV
jgi:hypothetical protein